MGGGPDPVAIFFSPGKRALFPALGSSYEVLSHPRALDLLRELRERTDRPFRLSTNGNRLTRDFIGELARLKPIYLYLSLNSSSRPGVGRSWGHRGRRRRFNPFRSSGNGESPLRSSSFPGLSPPKEKCFRTSGKRWPMRTVTMPIWQRLACPATAGISLPAAF